MFARLLFLVLGTLLLSWQVFANDPMLYHIKITDTRGDEHCGHLVIAGLEKSEVEAIHTRLVADSPRFISQLAIPAAGFPAPEASLTGTIYSLIMGTDGKLRLDGETTADDTELLAPVILSHARNVLGLSNHYLCQECTPDTIAVLMAKALEKRARRLRIAPQLPVTYVIE